MVNYMHMAMRILRTASEVVDAFGGTKAAAEWAGIGESAVSNWLAREFIPPGWHFRMQEHFSEHGIKLAASVFGQREGQPPRPRSDMRLSA